MKKSIFICLMSAAIGCGGHSATSGFRVESSSFKDGDYILPEYSCEGRDISPEIHWDYPTVADSFAVICEDPDAPGGTFIHWVVYNIPGSYVSLAKGFPKNGAPEGILQGRNDFGEPGYNGPCPPKGKAHRYIFTVYALDKKITGKGLSAGGLKSEMKGHIKASGSITGMFKR